MAQANNGIAVTEQNQQVDKLASAGEGKRKEVEQKLEALNFAQIGHGGMDSESRDSSGSTNYIALEKRKAVAEKPKPQPKLAAAAPAQAGKKSQTLFGRNARQEIVVQEATAQTRGSADISQLSAVNGTVNVSGTIDASQGSANFGFALPSIDLDDAFRADGRRAVAVDFPVEGTAYHFQKLKDHAELRIESREPANLERGKWLLWLSVCVGLIALGEQLRRRTVARFSH